MSRTCAWLGRSRSAACRTSDRTARRTRSIRLSTTATCTPPTAEARSTRSTRAIPTRASSSGSAIPASGTRALFRAPAASRGWRPRSSPTSRPAASSPPLATAPRRGDNLYTNSAVALDIDTGKLVWHFQYTPNDGWDYDEIGVHMLYNATINGENRKVVGHFGRNGFFYSLDRANGSFIKGTQYVNALNWTKGLDPKTGKPVEYDAKLDVQAYIPEARQLRGDGMKRTCPTWHGGVG